MRRSTTIWSEAGLEGLILDTADGSRSGKDLKALVDHARRMRTLMRYAPRKYDPALVEALAHQRRADARPRRDGQDEARRRRSPQWLGAGDLEATWSGEVAAEGGYLLQPAVARRHRRPRSSSRASSSRPKRASSTRWRRNRPQPTPAPSTLRTLKKAAAADRAEPKPLDATRGRGRSRRAKPTPRASRSPSPARPSCSTPCSPPAARASASSATRALAK